MITQGAALPEDATSEERLTYRYRLSQRRKWLNKLQKALNNDDLVEAEEEDEDDEGVQKQPVGKCRSRTRNMIVEALGATRKDLASDLDGPQV